MQPSSPPDLPAEPSPRKGLEQQGYSRVTKGMFLEGNKTELPGQRAACKTPKDLRSTQREATSHFHAQRWSFLEKHKLKPTIELVADFRSAMVEIVSPKPKTPSNMNVDQCPPRAKNDSRLTNNDKPRNFGGTLE
jgi:hypothetical protein